jgi:hypothetical protein
MLGMVGEQWSSRAAQRQQYASSEQERLKREAIVWVMRDGTGCKLGTGNDMPPLDAVRCGAVRCCGPVVSVGGA